MNIESAARDYLGELHIRSSSQHTRRAYLREVEDFVRFIGDRRLERSLYREYIGTLGRRSLSRISIARAQAVLRAFFGWMENEGLICAEQNVTTLLPGVRQPRKLPRVPSEAQIAALLSGPLAGSAWPERDRAMLELLYATGMRAQELVSLKIEDLWLTNRAVRVRGKGGKERISVFGEPAAATLSAYLESRGRRMQKSTTATLFVSLGKGPRSEQMTTRSLHRIVGALGKSAGIPDLRPHLLRHACATHWMERGAGIGAIRCQLGHEKLSTTMGYARLSVGRTLSAYRAAMTGPEPSEETVQVGVLGSTPCTDMGGGMRNVTIRVSG
jgi:integrase/recombinase XerC